MKKFIIYMVISVLFFYTQTHAMYYNDNVPLSLYYNNEIFSLKKIGYLKPIKGLKCLNNLPLHQKQEQIIVLKPTNKEIMNNIIEKVEFPLAKAKLYNKTDKLYKNVPVYARINIYSVENNLPSKKIFTSLPIEFVMSKNGFISVDISEQSIILSEQGLCFGIKLIGKIDEEKKIIEDKKIHTRPLLTNQSSDDYSAVTYIVRP